MLFLPLKQIHSEGELGVVDDYLVDLHEGTHEHAVVFAEIVFETYAPVEGAVTRGKVSVFEVALRRLCQPPCFFLVGAVIDAVPEVIGTAEAEGETIVVDLEHRRGGQMQAAGKTVFHQRDGVVAGEIGIAIIESLNRFFVHTLGLAGPPKIQSHIITELGMELSVEAQLNYVSEIIWTF